MRIGLLHRQYYLQNGAPLAAPDWHRPCTAGIDILGSHHFTFSDDGALLKSGVFRGILRVLAGLRINGRRQVEVTAYAVRAFFDAHLKGATGSTITLPTPAFPEIVVLQ